MIYPEFKSLNLSEIDREMLKYWADQKIFERTLDRKDSSPSFVFYEGPPSANGMPGIHHVVGRTIKDIFCRYKTLRGYYVPRKGGWDTHGLPIELRVEQDLGITKEDIGTKITIEAYNQKCKETVFEYKQKWDELTQKMGYWLDLDNPYITYENEYIESVWWVLSQIYEKGLMYKGYTIQPYSPAAGTGLSTHELNQPGTYRDVTDTTVVACFEVLDIDQINQAYGVSVTTAHILAWTTTPWTLPANTALCVGPRIMYSLVQTYNPYTRQLQNVVLASELISKWLDPKHEVLEGDLPEPSDKVLPYKVLGEVNGSQLVGIKYQQLLTFESNARESIDGDCFRVISGDFVTTTDGTGIVHIAPSFGADDRKVAKEHQIGEPIYLGADGSKSFMVDLQGKFVPGMGYLSGRYVKNYRDEAEYKAPDIDIVIDLKTQGKAFNVQKYVHSYPHCWRTDKPVIYYPIDSWFIQTTAVKEQLIANNKKINWKPESTGTGRFGQWLENLQDWSLSRSRFWGIPLPIWSDELHKTYRCISSYQQLKQLILEANASDVLTEEQKNQNQSFLELFDKGKGDLHKPYIDRVTLVCGDQVLKRDPDVIDVWFDSGSMPYAQWGIGSDNVDKLFTDHKYPADFIAEGVDQTRGWFYTLHAISTMLFDRPAFRNVISNGLVLDRNGEKMSKRKGNVIDPFATIDLYGADAVRWYVISNAQPWDNLKFDLKGVEETKRKLFGTLFNTYQFYAMYANVDEYIPSLDLSSVRSNANDLDLWVLSKLESLKLEVTEFFDAYEPTMAARAIETFVDRNLSNWYVRLCRRRFWKNEASQDKKAAYETLYHCLYTITQLMSPIAPFYSDWMYRNLSKPLSDKLESVHLTQWPEIDHEWIQPDLERRIELAQDLCSMILSIRKKEQIKVRQPLAQVMIPVLNSAQKEDISYIRDIIMSETNVKQVTMIEDAGVFVKSAKANFKVLGKKLGRDMNEVAQQIAAMDQAQIASYESIGSIEIKGYQIEAGEIEILTSDMPGYTIATEGGRTLALDINITEPLMLEGYARELVNKIQNYRKDQGYNVTDRIAIQIANHEIIERVLNSYHEYISNEVLAESIKFAPLNQNMIAFDLNDQQIFILITKI